MEVEPGRYSGAVVVVNGSSVGVVGIFDGVVDLVVDTDVVDIRWGVKPCGDVVVVLTVGVLRLLDGFVNFVVLLPDIVDIR